MTIKYIPATLKVTFNNLKQLKMHILIVNYIIPLATLGLRSRSINNYNIDSLREVIHPRANKMILVVIISNHLTKQCKKICKRSLTISHSRATLEPVKTNSNLNVTIKKYKTTGPHFHLKITLM